MCIWGGPQRRVRLVLCLGLLRGISLVLAAAILSPAAIAFMLFALYFGMPISNACSQVIWQHKTPVDMQGRVFSIRLMIAWSATPLAYIVAGPLAEKIFEGSLVLMFIVLGIVLTTAAVIGYLYPRLRRLEDELPDRTFDAAPAVA